MGNVLVRIGLATRGSVGVETLLVVGLRLVKTSLKIMSGM
jgi:hypothetical protein